MNKKFELSRRGISAYIWGVLALTLIGIALRTVNMFLLFDYDINYYSAGAALPTVSGIFFLLVAAFITVACAGSQELPFAEDLSKSSISVKVSSALCTVAFILAASELLGSVTLIPNAVLMTALYISAVYFILNLSRSPSGAQALTSVAVIISLSSLIAITYFDVYTQMNSPLKVHFHLAMLASMLFITAEARSMIGMTKKRFYLFSLSLAVLLTGIDSVPNAAAIFAGKLEYDIIPFYYICDTVTFFLFIYFVCRLISLNASIRKTPATLDESADSKENSDTSATESTPVDGEDSRDSAEEL